MKEKGFTLIEVIVAVALVAITAGAGYTFYLNTFKFQVLQERQKDMQVRLQLAMNLLVSDIRSAGYGIMNPLSRGEDRGSTVCASTIGADLPIRPFPLALCAAVTQGNGGIGAPDTIALSERFQLKGSLGAPAAPGNLIVVQPPLGGGNLVLPADNLITIGGLFTSTVIGVAGQTVTLGTPLTDRNSYPTGMSVYTVGNVLYSIGPPGLLQNNILIVPGIEDLQVAYFLNGNLPGGPALPSNNPSFPIPQGSTVPGAKNAYLAVRISLVARVNDADPTYQGGQAPLRLEDHESRIAPDNFRRAVLTRVVELLADGCGPGDTAC